MDTTARLWTTAMRVWTLPTRCVLCVLRVGVCMYARLCFCVLEPHIIIFLMVCVVLLLLCVSGLYHTLKLSSSPLCDSHVTTVVAHQVPPFVTATDGASVCACVCVLCFLLERTHHLNTGAIMLRRGQGDVNPHLPPRDYKSNRAAKVAPTASVQQRYSGTAVVCIVQQHHQRFKLWPLR